MNAQELMQHCLQQEETYQFTHFDRDDVWALGCALVESARSMEGPLAVEIELNGTVVFRHFPAGTGAFHEQWLARKRNTVRLTGHSSLYIFADLAARGVTMQEDMRLDSVEYADCGGGFPLRLRGGCVIGSLCASGLPHLRDHATVIQALDRFFQTHPQT